MNINPLIINWMDQESKRPAFGLDITTKDINDGIQSHQYFYSTVNLILHNGDASKEPFCRKKRLSTTLKTCRQLNDQDLEFKKYLNFKDRKHELMQKLKDTMRKNKLESLQKKIKGHIKAGKDFASLGLPSLKKEFAQQELEFMEAYNKCADLFSEKNKANRISQDLKELDIDLKKIPKPEKKEKCTEEKSKIIDNWEKELEKNYNLIKTVWKSKHTELIDLPLRELKVSLEREVDMLGKEAGLKPTQNIGFKTVLNIFSEELKKYLAEQKNKSVMTVEKYLEASDHSLIKEYEKVQVEEEIQLIEGILKEQKKHTMARFCNLIPHYYDFVRHIKMIEKKAGELCPNGGEIVRAICVELISRSYYEDNSSGKETSVLDTHHHASLMGHEKKGLYSDEDKEIAIHKINVAMGTDLKKTTKSFQRAHTQPFPAMFNWDPEKMKKILLVHGLKMEDADLSKTYIKADFFKEMKEKRDINVLDSSLMQELEKIQKSTTTLDKEGKANAAKFIFLALETLKEFHLRIFSETQFVPDFINAKLDQLSEWKHELNNNYKISLAQAMIGLIHEKEVSLEKVAQALEIYRKGAETKISEKLDKPKKETIRSLVYQIGTLQVQQSITLGWLEATDKTNQVVKNIALKAF
jgi:hypothetical protein